MKRRRISQVGIAGILAVISAVGLIAIVSLSNGTLKQINPTEQQQTVDAMVRVRVTQTAEMRATSQATAEATDVIDPIWQTATAVYLYRVQTQEVLPHPVRPLRLMCGSK